MALELHIWFTDGEKEHDYDTLLAIGEKVHHDYKGIHPIDYDVVEVPDLPAGMAPDPWERSLLDIEIEARAKENNND